MSFENVAPPTNWHFGPLTAGSFPLTGVQAWCLPTHSPQRS